MHNFSSSVSIWGVQIVTFFRLTFINHTYIHTHKSPTYSLLVPCYFCQYFNYCLHYHSLNTSICTCFHLPAPPPSVFHPFLAGKVPQVTASFHNLAISTDIRGGIKSYRILGPFAIVSFKI